MERDGTGCGIPTETMRGGKWVGDAKCWGYAMAAAAVWVSRCVDSGGHDGAHGGTPERGGEVNAALGSSRCDRPPSFLWVVVLPCLKARWSDSIFFWFVLIIRKFWVAVAFRMQISKWVKRCELFSFGSLFDWATWDCDFDLRGGLVWDTSIGFLGTEIPAV